MNNNSSEKRIKAITVYGYLQALKESGFKPEKNYHFIGLGDGAVNVLKHMHVRKIAGKYTAVGNPDLPLPEGINLIRFVPSAFKEIKTSRHTFIYPDHEVPVELPADVLPLFNEDNNNLLLVSAGGYSGSGLAAALIPVLKEKKVSFLVIFSYPFNFEGSKRHNAADDLLEIMSGMRNYISFKLDDLNCEYPNLKLNQAFEAADHAHYRIVRKLLVIGRHIDSCEYE
jgi:hypothetical protein